MKRLLTTILSTTSICVFLSATPASAQYSTTPGAPTQTQNQTSTQPAGPMSAIASGLTAPFAALTGAGRSATASHPMCRAQKDWNGRYTALCGP